jgi:DNA-binding IclR family transcriptional regulator
MDDAMITESHATALATNSLERGLALMGAIGEKRGGMTNTDLSRQLAIPKSTCTYILTRLERQGFVFRNKITGRYRLGLKALTLAHGALREIGFDAIAEPVLYRLASGTGLVAVVGVLEGHRVLTVERVESPEFMDAGRSKWPYYAPRDERVVGAEMSLHASAAGRVLLAYMPRGELLDTLELILLTKIGPETITCKTRLLAELERIRDQGYAIADQQVHEDSCAIGAPIFDTHGAVLAAVSAGGSRELPIFRDSGRLVSAVRGAAREISQQLARPLMWASM